MKKVFCLMLIVLVLVSSPCVALGDSIQEELAIFVKEYFSFREQSFVDARDGNKINSYYQKNH